ncbi:hypothetical protein BZA05DRAFT_446357 [Tricharina praecox]|uniref:uncharacterized protein n=1 Tax=Tricharina praecox TaxID=43433 RepID=UPI00221F762F|nr:uncharacterized protein BZA05DRAFT_446357 [Tricharina praecox]KAI5848829.1 hypothetical protein BZA05DRAFT_446357 [Tricharina praecox]
MATSTDTTATTITITSSPILEIAAPSNTALQAVTSYLEILAFLSELCADFGAEEGDNHSVEHSDAGEEEEEEEEANDDQAGGKTEDKNDQDYEGAEEGQ